MLAATPPARVETNAGEPDMLTTSTPRSVLIVKFDQRGARVQDDSSLAKAGGVVRGR